MSNDDLKKRLKKLTDSIVEPPVGEMAAPYALALAQADKFVALTALLPPTFVVRALVGPMPGEDPERTRMQKRRDAVRQLFLGGERKAAVEFMKKHAAAQIPAIEAVAKVASETFGKPDAKKKLGAAIKKGQFTDDLDPDTLAVLVLFQCEAIAEAPLRALLEDGRTPDQAKLEAALQRRADLVSLLSQCFLTRPITKGETR